MWSSLGPDFLPVEIDGAKKPRRVLCIRCGAPEPVGSQLCGSGKLWLWGGWWGEAVVALDGTAAVSECTAGKVCKAGNAFEGHGALDALVERFWQADGVAVRGAFLSEGAWFFGRAHVRLHRAGA